jgi:hypothetical protein
VASKAAPDPFTVGSGQGSYVDRVRRASIYCETEGKKEMTEPTSPQRSAALNVAKAVAETMLKGHQDASLKSIFSAAQLKIVDKWIIDNDPTLGRSEAIRRLVELGAEAKGK